MLKRFRGDKGFTLIELLVVILIIGILAAVAIPSLLNQQDKAKDSGALQKARTAFAVAKSESVALEGKFPTVGSLASAIAVSEPNLTVVPTSAAPVASNMTADSVYVVSGTSPSATVGVYVKSASGKVASITVDSAGKQSVQTQ